MVGGGEGAFIGAVHRSAAGLDQAVELVCGAFALIVLFNARRPILARDLARDLALSDVTVSRFVKRMEDDGWVERTPDPDDGRAMRLQPTAYARAQFGPLVAVCNQVLDDLFGGFTRSDLESLAAVVERVQRNLESHVGTESEDPAEG